jgi:Xaa-Pro aminopeptidase
MKRSVFQKRLSSFRERLVKIPPDAAWIIQPENRRYLSRFKAEDAQLNESSGSLLITHEANLLITDSRYETEARKEAPDFEVILFNKGLLEGLSELIESLGIKKLGFEEDHLTWGLHQKLAKKLRTITSPVRLSPLKEIVEEMRLIKDNDEIQAMAASAGLMSEILDEVIEGLEPGLTEKSIAWQIEGLARERGAEALAFPSIVASGPNGALPHAVPTSRKLVTGKPIVLDVGLKVDGYCCDMTRTVFLGKPETRFRKIYKIVRQAQLAALQEIRPGVESTYPDSVAREVIKDAGFGEYFGHSLGHGVGLATHERPRLSPQGPVVLKEGMVVTVEPGIYLPGKGGVRLEEMVVIENNGPRILTTERHFYNF